MIRNRAIPAVFLLLHASTLLAAGKPRVAVLEFQDKSSTYSWYRAGRAAQDMMVTELVAKGNYRVIDREQLAALQREKNLSLEGDIDPKTAVRAGKLLGVEYFITGAVTELGTTQKNTNVPGVGGFPGFSRRSEKMKAALDARAISATTGEIVWADTANAETSDSATYVGGAGGGSRDEKKLDKLLRPIVQQLAESLGAKKLDTTGLGGAGDSKLAGKIANVSPEGVYLNIGSEAEVKEGDEFDVVRVGKVIKDPDTGEVLGADETRIGRVRIVAIKGPRLSLATAVPGPKASFQVGDILRK